MFNEEFLALSCPLTFGDSTLTNELPILTHRTAEQKGEKGQKETERQKEKSRSLRRNGGRWREIWQPRRRAGEMRGVDIPEDREAALLRPEEGVGF